MGGSSSNKKKDSKATPAKQDYTQGPSQQITQPFAPGMQQLLADQLSVGFGATPASNMGLLDNIYSPMTQTLYQEPISSTQEAMKTGNWNDIKTGDLTLDNMLNNRAVGTPYPQPAPPPAAKPSKAASGGSQGSSTPSTYKDYFTQRSGGR